MYGLGPMESFMLNTPRIFSWEPWAALPLARQVLQERQEERVKEAP